MTGKLGDMVSLFRLVSGEVVAMGCVEDVRLEEK